MEWLAPLVSHVFVHAVTDTAKMLPFLFAAYLLIEWLERSRSGRMEALLAKGGRFGFVPAALLGCVPQCGFSAMAANFYGSGVVTLGTLLAVFVATSDEAVPVMLAQPQSYRWILPLIAAKLLWALAVGFLFDVVLRRVLPASLRGGYRGSAAEVNCHNHEEEDKLWLAALKHTVSIFLTVLLFTFLFGLVVELAGEDTIRRLLAGLGPAQPLLAALFGLIPNCASSVLLTQLFLDGQVSFGSLFSGLTANAGIGFTVLFRANRSLRQNLFIVLLMVLAGVLPGTVLHLIGV